MSTIKEVSVRLTEADEKALQAPRRKRTRKAGGALEGAPIPITEKAAIEIAEHPLPTQSLPLPEPAGVASVATERAMDFETALPPPPPILPTVGGSSKSTTATPTTPVKIQTRKRHVGRTETPNTVKGAVILPVKRHKLPSKDKPKLVIPIQGGHVAKGALVGAETPTPPPPAPLKPVGGGKRRFTERRLSISMKALKSTRKAGKSIRKQVAAMTTEQIRKTLLEKKVLKPSSNPPESMLRSMMKDYLALAK